MRDRAALFTLALLLSSEAGCRRAVTLASQGAIGGGALAVAESVKGIDDEAPSAPRDDAEDERAIVRARRLTLRSLADDPSLRPLVPLAQAQIGEGVVKVQVLNMPGDRRAVLVQGSDADRPFLGVLDGSGAVLWSKDKPLAGIRSGSTELAIVSGKRGDVMLAWYDKPTRYVALRRWDALGHAVGDFTLLEVESCEAVSALYWPSRGIVVAASTPGAARIQLLDEHGIMPWGGRGVSLSWASTAGARVSIAPDTGSSFIVAQVGYPKEGPLPASPDKLFAMRYAMSPPGEGGAAEDPLPPKTLWERPVDLGPLAAPFGAPECEPASSGWVRVTIATGKGKKVVEVSADARVKE